MGDYWFRNRWDEVSAALSLADPWSPAHDPAAFQHRKDYKLAGFVALWASALRALWSHGTRLSVDEAMVRFKGRSHLVQFMPAKPVKRGLKFFCVCCAATGALLHFQLYTGAGSGGTADIFLSLLSNAAVPAGSLIFADNFFSSVSLAKTLLARGWHYCGTIRKGRTNTKQPLEGVPTSGGFTPNNPTRDEARGTAAWRWQQLLVPGRRALRATLSLVRWRDTKHVYCLSAAYPPSPPPP